MYKRLALIFSFITVFSFNVNANSPLDPRTCAKYSEVDLKTYNYLKLGLGYGKSEIVETISDCSLGQCRNIKFKHFYFGDIAVGSNAFFKDLVPNGSVRNELLFHYSTRFAKNKNVERGQKLRFLDTENIAANLKLKTYALFLNTCVDLVTFGQVTPFIGGGLGLAQHRLTGSLGQVPVKANTSDVTLAWNLTGGINVPVNSQVTLFSSYRYIDLGKIKASTETKWSSSSTIVTHKQNFEVPTRSHQYLIGLMYSF